MRFARRVPAHRARHLIEARSGAGLTEALRPALLRPGDACEVRRLLLVGAVEHEAGPDHADALVVLPRGAAVLHLLAENDLAQYVGATARAADQTALVQLVMIELQYLFDRGGSPEIEQYFSRFPGDHAAIEELLPYWKELKKAVSAFIGQEAFHTREHEEYNEAMVEALPRFRQRRNIMILHVTGRYSDGEYDAVADTASHLERLGIIGDTSSWYRRYVYMENLQDAYAAADLIICRGGAGTLTEVSVCGRPSVIVPLATAAEDHQAFNARELARRGAARVLYQEATWVKGRVLSIVSPTKLADLVSELLDSPPVLQEMAMASHAVPRRDSLELILGEISNLLVGRRPPPLTLQFPLRQEGVPSDPNVHLNAVRDRIADAGGVAGLDPPELSYLRYQADRYLASEEWYEIPLGRRNVGVKLVGILQYNERLDVILSILQDKTKTRWIRRICGGDFRHPGILRRNAVEFGIRLQEGAEADDRIRDVLLQALATDPYFEVRAAAACELGRRFFPPCDLIEDALLETLESDRSSRVVIQAIKGLGRIGRGDRVLGCFRSFYLHADWQFRQEVVTALRKLLERGVLDPALVAGEVGQVLDASPGFEPAFPLKENLRDLAAEGSAALDEGKRRSAGGH